MLSGINNFLNCKVIRFKRVEFCFYSPLRDSKPVRYFRKFAISGFVITVQYCKDLIRILT